MIVLLWAVLISLPQLMVSKLWSLIFTILAGVAGQYLPKKTLDDQIRRMAKKWRNQRAIRRTIRAEEKAKRSRIESAEAIKAAAEAAFDECTENPPLIPPCVIWRDIRPDHILQVMVDESLRRMITGSYTGMYVSDSNAQPQSPPSGMNRLWYRPHRDRIPEDETGQRHFLDVSLYRNGNEDYPLRVLLAIPNFNIKENDDRHYIKFYDGEILRQEQEPPSNECQFVMSRDVYNREIKRLIVMMSPRSPTTSPIKAQSDLSNISSRVLADYETLGKSFAQLEHEKTQNQI